jgi:hypothetical protein
MLEYARANHLVSDELLELGINGCKQDNLTAKVFWPVLQHLTVAELRSALGIDKQPVGLGDAIANAFPGVEMRYLHEP